LTVHKGVAGNNIAERTHPGRLIKALRNNEGWAIAEISKWIEPIIKNKIYAFDDWEDVRQQSLMELVIAVNACKTVNSLWGLVRRIAITTVIDHNRKYQRSRNRKPHQTAGNGGESDNPATRIPDHRSGADTIVESRDLFLYIYQRVGKKCREIIDLVFIKGFTYEQAAEALGIREGNLRVSVHRCRDRAMELRAEAARLQ
jgi:RNA polymerase sigma factor (sigma-70 family)